MEKTFKTLNDLLDLNFTELDPKSNFLRLIPTDGNLPKIREKFQPKKWRIITREPKTEIIFEITPRWITITVHNGDCSRIKNFNVFKKNPKEIIEEIFEI